MGCEAAIASEHYLDITTRQKGHQVMPGSTLAKHDLSRVIHPHRVKHTFCDLDPEYTHLLLHWTRLLWLHGFTDFEIIVAHRSRSAQGRVHFITTGCIEHCQIEMGHGLSNLPRQMIRWELGIDLPPRY